MANVEMTGMGNDKGGRADKIGIEFSDLSIVNYLEGTGCQLADTVC